MIYALIEPLGLGLGQGGRPITSICPFLLFCVAVEVSTPLTMAGLAMGILNLAIVILQVDFSFFHFFMFI